MEDILAPVVLFAYNRPHHTLRVLESIKRNELAKQTTIFIYCDGPRPDASIEMMNQVSGVRNIVKSEKWCKEVVIIESDKNNGLANSIIKGVTEVVNRFGKAIILEDDIVVSNYFLDYMNSALRVYECSSTVMSVSGYMFPGDKRKLNETFFLQIDSSWGWGTWKRAWDKFNSNSEYLLEKINSRKKKNDFNFKNTYDFYNMLIEERDGIISSWAIRWYASIFVENGVTLFPRYTLVHNIGHDGSGIHCNKTTDYDQDFDPEQKINVARIEVINENETARTELSRFFKKMDKSSVINRLRTMLK